MDLLPNDQTEALVTIGQLSPVMSNFVVLGGFALVLPLLGYLVFARGMRKAQADGGLSRWA